jgi:trans-aconitate methyltransferase
MVRPSAFGRQKDPYTLGDANDSSIDKYLQTATLSPWVPLPDSVARKAMDLANAGPLDQHVDLGCGDGRVNFHAVDGYRVATSLGVDIDVALVEQAQQRLAKRHPLPTNVEFVVADLSNATHAVWTRIQQATLITMYFTTEALHKLRPILEQHLVGRSCKLVTCGYEMPGWDASASEVVLGTQIHLYEWGLSSLNENGSSTNAAESAVEMFLDDEELQRKLDHLTLRQLEGSKFAGSTVIDRTSSFPIQGYNPNLKFEEEDDDEDWDAATEDDTVQTTSERTRSIPPAPKTTSNCSKR